MSKRFAIAAGLFALLTLAALGYVGYRRWHRAPGEQTPAAERFDVVVVGATPAGVAAAVNAARGGATVALLQEDGHVGGGTAGGLSHTDFRTYESLGGTWRDFMGRVERHYVKAYGRDSRQARDCWRGAYYEPRVARRVFEEMLAEQKVRVFLHHQLDGVSTEPSAEGRRRVVRAKFLDRAEERPAEFEAKAFIDATYEGDLLAAAGVKYRLGCEGRDEYGESLAPAEANRHVMVCNFRVTLTRDPANRLPLPKPADYDRARYAKAVGLIADGTVTRKEIGGAGWPLDDLLRARPVPNAKADFNDKMRSPVSIKLFAEAAEWPEATPQRRAEIYQKAKDHALGMFWFLAHDPKLPGWVRDGMRVWGLPKDEYPDTGHWTPFLYVREGRRMVGEAVFTQKDCELHPGSVRSRLHADGVAIGDYGINSHGTHLGPKGELLGVISRGPRPFQVPYGVMVPKGVDGLLVPVAVSASHVGYCALRMEPTWTALGQAAGVAAGRAVRDGVEVRAVDVAGVQRRLHALGAKTVYVSDVEADAPHFRAAQWFGTRGFFHDLVPPARAKGWGRKALSPTNQWTTAFPHHALGADRPIDEALAARWRKAAKAPEGPRLAADGELSRGEFLQRLFQGVPE